MSSVQESKRIQKRLLGCGYTYVKGVTDESEVINGISFFLINKQILTFAIADTLWVDTKNKPYKFKLDGTVLFIDRLAIGFGKRGI